MLKGLVRDDGSIDTRSKEQPAEITKNSRPESYYKSYAHYVSALTLVAGLEEKELSEKIGLKTSIQFNDQGSSGSITLYYSDLDQLDEIMRLSLIHI